MKESFGPDGLPRSYADIDECDAIFLWGHSLTETQTVLWACVLDRLAHPQPPRPLWAGPRASLDSPQAG